MPWNTQNIKEIYFLVFQGPVPEKWLFWDRSHFFGTDPLKTGSFIFSKLFIFNLYWKTFPNTDYPSIQPTYKLDYTKAILEH